MFASPSRPVKVLTSVMVVYPKGGVAVDVGSKRWGSVKDSPMRIEKLIFNCLEHLIPSERSTMLKKILWKSVWHKDRKN